MKSFSARFVLVFQANNEKEALNYIKKLETKFQDCVDNLYVELDKPVLDKKAIENTFPNVWW